MIWSHLSEFIQIHDLIINPLVFLPAEEVAEDEASDVVIDQVLALVLRQVSQ